MKREEENLHTPTMDGLTASEIRALADDVTPGEVVKHVRARTGLTLADALNLYKTFKEKHVTEVHSAIGVRIGWTVSDEAVEWATR